MVVVIEELKPGDEVWVKATVVETPALADAVWVNIPNTDGPAELRIATDNSRKSPPSEQPESNWEHSNGPGIGDLVAVRAIVNGRNADGTLQVAVGPHLDLVNEVHLRTVRSWPPSEHSETAELNAKIVEAAEAFRNVMNTPQNEEEWHDLEHAVDAKRKALTPPSIEDAVHEIVRECFGAGLGVEPQYSSEYARFTDRILALVSVHES